MGPQILQTGSIGLQWDAQAVDHYNIYRSPSPIVSLEGMIPVANVTTNYYNDTLDTTGTYYYVVTGVNVEGEGLPSNNVYVLVEEGLSVDVTVDGDGVVTSFVTETNSGSLPVAFSFALVPLILIPLLHKRRRV